MTICREFSTQSSSASRTTCAKVSSAMITFAPESAICVRSSVAVSRVLQLTAIPPTPAMANCATTCIGAFLNITATRSPRVTQPSVESTAASAHVSWSSVRGERDAVTLRCSRDTSWIAEKEAEPLSDVLTFSACHRLPTSSALVDTGGMGMRATPVDGDERDFEQGILCRCVMTRMTGQCAWKLLLPPAFCCAEDGRFYCRSYEDYSV
jgi:hypothetical protein